MGSRARHLLALALLAGTLAVLAALQYRWLGDVSRAERTRLEAGLRARAAGFVAEFDRDITRLYGAFQLSASALDADAPAALQAAADRASRETASGRTLQGIFVVEVTQGAHGSDPAATAMLQLFEPSSGRLVHADWPGALSGARAALEQRHPEALPVGTPLPLPAAFLGNVIDPSAPALFVPVIDTLPLPLPPEPDGPGRDYMLRARTTPRAARVVILWLNRARLVSEVLAPLVARHFGDPSSEFVVAVVPAAGGAGPIFTSDPERTPSSPGADYGADLFAIRLDELQWNRSVPGGGPDVAGAEPDRVAVTIIRRSPSGAPAGPARTSTQAAWRLLVQARTGSLDAIVSRSRTRSMAISLGVLALLAVSVVLVVAASAREQRLARQQIEFVASVSHELRTPLAVIRSAAENLADGVVGAAQMAEYGALIRNEGRRLSDMLERVMDYAGLAGGQSNRPRGEVVVGDVLAAALAGVTPDARDRGQAITITGEGGGATLVGDAEAIRSALQNVVGNAVKYGPHGGVVEVEVHGADGRVRITVADRGIGIDQDDLPHVFTPFYRGRRAVAAQVRGSGIGLGIARAVVDTHGGSITVAPRNGGGTVVSIELPVSGTVKAG